MRNIILDFDGRFWCTDERGGSPAPSTNQSFSGIITGYFQNAKADDKHLLDTTQLRPLSTSRQSEVAQTNHKPHVIAEVLLKLNRRGI